MVTVAAVSLSEWDLTGSFSLGPQITSEHMRPQWEVSSHGTLIVETEPGFRSSDSWSRAFLSAFLRAELGSWPSVVFGLQRAEDRTLCSESP